MLQNSGLFPLEESTETFRDKVSETRPTNGNDSPTNQTRVGQQAVGVVLLQAARQRARLRLAVDEEVGQSGPKTQTHSGHSESQIRVT